MLRSPPDPWLCFSIITKKEEFHWMATVETAAAAPQLLRVVLALQLVVANARRLQGKSYDANLSMGRLLWRRAGMRLAQQARASGLTKEDSLRDLVVRSAALWLDTEDDGAAGGHMPDTPMEDEHAFEEIFEEMGSREEWRADDEHSVVVDEVMPMDSLIVEEDEEDG
eukprot:PLAT12751.2.p1 GENE.PLAT12751.2~~PLAT12751.2.p1  ORF type:complete len:182 (-),score=99.08 PLAT12751.2:200-703(-)